MEAVSTSAFGRSLAALERAAEMYERLKTGDLRVTARNSLILEFEVCYGQTRPLLERGLIEMSGESPADLGSMTFRGLIQLANERGFSKYGVEDWLSFREMRNRTAHAYSEPLAESIVAAIPLFLACAQDMAENIRAKQAEVK
jgi:hypothetical protein